MDDAWARAGRGGAERLLPRAIADSSDLVSVKDASGRYLLVNEAGLVLLGRDAAEVIGRSDADLLGPPGEALREADLRVMRSGQPLTVDEVVSRGTQTLLLETTKTPLRDLDGRIIGVLACSRDVTARRRLEAELERAHGQLAAAEQVAKLGSWDYDFRTDEVRWSAELYRILGLDEASSEPAFEQLLDRLPAADAVRVLEVVQAAVEGREPIEIEHRVIRPDGEERVVLCRMQVIRDVDGSPLRMIGVAVDVTDRALAEGRLRREIDDARRQALSDPLTGLPNRAYAIERLEHALRAAELSDRELAVLFVDVDGLKEANDEHGHAFGDMLLRETAERLGAAVRAGDTVARYGGDEFVVICEELPDSGAALLAAWRLEAALEPPFAAPGGEAGPLRASIGAAARAGRRIGPEALITEADADMYRVKRAKRSAYRAGR